MSHRHFSREIALQVLYRNDFSPEDFQRNSEAAMADAIRGHFDHFKVPENAREFAALLIAGTLQNLTKLDPMIETQASNWKLERMAHVDRCLLRLALWELLDHPDTPPLVVIDEAIELAKKYGTQESPSFINGILDSIRKEKCA